MRCNKIPYDSKTDALAVIRGIYVQRRYIGERCRKDGRRLRAYECPLCKKWHLTTRSKRKYD